MALAGRILEPLIVEREALSQVFVQSLGGPLAELRAAMAADAVTDGENGRQAIVAEAARNLPATLPTNL